MPGVTVDLAVRPSPPAAFAPDTAQYFVVGLTERGSTTGVETVTSMAEVQEKLGAEVPFGFVYADLRRFFALGGARARVARVVGGAATTATSTLSDRAGTPAPTLRIDAANPGVWGSQHLTRRVEAGTTAGSYRIVIAYAGVDVETKDNLVTPTDAVNAFARSIYVRAVDLSSATAAPNNQPAIVASAALTGGSDDRASVVTADVTGALSRFTKDLGVGAVAIPGYSATLVGAALKAHANSNRRVAGFAAAKGTSRADAKALADTLDGTDGGGSLLLWPWVEADGDGTPLVSPEGVWAGLRAAAHRTVGPWAVPAGEAGQVGFITGLEVEVTDAQGDDLDAAKVSVFRKIRHNGSDTFRLYGYRSLSTDPNFTYLKTQDLANYIEEVCENDAQPYVFAQPGSRGRIAGEVSAALIGRLDALYEAGALTDRLDPATNTYVPNTAYRVDAGPSVNTSEVLERQEFDVYVAFRDSSVAGEIVIHVVKAGLTAAI